MKLSRRELIAAAASSAAAFAQAPGPPPPAPKPRTRPAVAVFSKPLQKLHYSELGGVIRDMGFDGCDLTVRPGGHVLPERAPADLVRAIEGIRDEGVDVPMITTAFTNPAADPWVRNVLAICGGMGVPFFKPGYWKYGAAADIPARLAQVKRDVAGLAAIGRAYKIAMGLHNHSGDNVGEAVWDTQSIIADLDPQWTGFYFDSMHAFVEGGLGGWSVSLRLALPRLKMVAVKDYTWTKKSGQWKPEPCPLGEGMVDWPKFFETLAQARFTGPISLHVEYNPPDQVAAMARDLEFVRKHIGSAYANVT